MTPEQSANAVRIARDLVLLCIDARLDVGRALDNFEYQVRGDEQCRGGRPGSMVGGRGSPSYCPDSAGPGQPPLKPEARLRLTELGQREARDGLPMREGWFEEVFDA
jgi:hypothetical protein